MSRRVAVFGPGMFDRGERSVEVGLCKVEVRELELRWCGRLEPERVDACEKVSASTVGIDELRDAALKLGRRGGNWRRPGRWSRLARSPRRVRSWLRSRWSPGGGRKSGSRSSAANDRRPIPDC